MRERTAHLLARPEHVGFQEARREQHQALPLPWQCSQHQLVVVMAMEVPSAEGHEQSRYDVVLNEPAERGPVLGHQVLPVGGHCMHSTQ